MSDWKAGVEAGTICPAHLKACGATREELEIVSLDLNHTCQPRNTEELNKNQRKRNYRTAHIANVSDVLDLYEPTRSKEGNTKQFIGMAKRATGFSLKTGQASRAIRSKSHDTLEAQIGQHLMLPSLFEAYRQQDPEGTYVLEDQVCGWNNTKRQFKRCHVALSFAMRFWEKAGIDMKICDGTFTKLTFTKHIILIAVTFDGNNQVIILEFCIVDVENADNWVYFKEKLDDDFPGCKVWMSDADKGINSRKFTLSLTQGEETFEKTRCVNHLSDNCRDSCGGKMNDEHKDWIRQLAKVHYAKGYG